MASVAVVKYNAGNIRSVLCALARLGVDAEVTDDPQLLKKASHVIFPGVGEASSAMRYLHQKHLDEVLVSLKQPFLGICLGMQLMCSLSEESHTECLGIYPTPVIRFQPSLKAKIPHMGWNSVTVYDNSLFNKIPDPSWFYFVHSYYVPLSKQTEACCIHGRTQFSAALNLSNFWGVQFHPEKSGPSGAQLLANFLQF